MNNMEKQNQIANLYEKELSLLKDLESCLKTERECLIKSDISTLGIVKREKERIFDNIRHVQEKRRRFLNNIGSVSHEEKKNFSIFNSKLKVCRVRIRTQIQENMDFVQDMLDFFEGLVSTIFVREDESKTYSNFKKVHCEAPPVMVHREV